MRISNHLMYKLGIRPIMDHQSNIAKVQEQISSGKKILKPSDDPTNSARLMELNKQIELNDQYGRNITLARGRLNAEESALQSSDDILQRVRELTVSAHNAAMTTENRRTIALEISQLRQQLVDVANSKDSEGAYLFSGFKEQTQPFTSDSSGVVNYSGDQGQRQLQTSPSRQVASSDSGDDVFMLIRNGNGQFQTNLTTGNTGTGTINGGGVIDLAAFQNTFMNHQYTINFTVIPDPSDASKTITTFDVQDETNTVINPPGVNQSYTAGQTITFNGVQVAVDGAPANGDSFVVKPAENQSLFKTLDNLISALGTADTQDHTRAVLYQSLDNALNDIDQGLLHLNQVRGKIGSRVNALDAQDDANQSFNVQLQTLSNNIGAVDYAGASSQLNEELLALQAAQQSFVKIQGLSLFNYIS